MTKRDALAAAGLAAVLLALLAPAWARTSPAFFNHGDLWTYHWPLRHHSATELISGRLPLWNPYVLLGVPHAANPQTALLYPLSILGFVLPALTALAWDQILHLLWAGLGAFLLARHQRLSRGPAVALAAAYALCPFLIFRITAGIPTLLASLAWVPWAWLAWLGGSAFLLSAVFALQFLSGHPQFLVVNAAGMALWAAIRAPRALPRLAAGAAGAAVLAAAQWLPLLELLLGSNRAGWPAEFAASYSLEPRAVLAWLVPSALGTPFDGRWTGPISVFYESCGVQLGLAAYAVAAAGLLRGGRAAAAAAGVAVAGFLLALGGNGPLAFLLTMPGASFLRTPSRWSLLCLWGLWLLFAAGLRSLERRGPSRRWAALAPLLALPLLLRAPAYLRGEDPAPYAASKPEIAALGGGASRVLVDPELANQNKSIVYRLRNANGYDAFYPAGSALWAAAAQGEPAADSSRVLVSNWKSDASARAGVAIRLGPSGLERSSDAWPLAAFVDAAGRRLKPDPALVLERPGRWLVAGPAPKGAAAVALAEQAWPGWRAFLGGSEAELGGWGPAFSLVELPPGLASVDLRFEFDPPLARLLPLAAALAWGAWLAAAARAARSAA